MTLTIGWIRGPRGSCLRRQFFSFRRLLSTPEVCVPQGSSTPESFTEPGTQQHASTFILRYSSSCQRRAFTTETISLHDLQPHEKVTYSRCRVSTLEPAALKPQDHIDLSNRFQTALRHISGERGLTSTKMVYGWDFDMSHRCSPFPPNTKGFWYLYKPSTEFPRRNPVHVEQWRTAASQIRFRLVDTPDPARFHEGSDLLATSGVPWHVPLFTMHKYTSYKQAYRHVTTAAEREDVQAYQNRCCATGVIGSMTSTILETILEPFSLDFSHSLVRLQILDPDSVTKFVSLSPFVTKRRGQPVEKSPYSGRALCRFEMIRSEDLSGANINADLFPECMVLRIIKWVERPNPSDSVFQEEGELVKKVNNDTGEERPWVWKKLGTFPSPLVDMLRSKYLYSSIFD